MRTFLTLLLSLCAVALNAQNPIVRSQWTTNAGDLNAFGKSITNANLLSTTNLVVKSATANRPAFISSSGNVTNASGTPDGTKFVRDDGVLAVPSFTDTGISTNSGTGTNNTFTSPTIVTAKTIGVTNLSPLLATASRPAFINAGGTITNASGTPDGTKFMRDDGVLAVPAGSGGTVTAVGLNTIPAQFGTNSGRITSSGDLGFTNVFQTANTVLAGPTTGSAANPAYRTLVAADIPTGGPYVATNDGTGWRTTFFSQTNSGTIYLTNGTRIEQPAANITTLTNGAWNHYSSSGTQVPGSFQGLTAHATNLTEWKTNGVIVANLQSNGQFRALGQITAGAAGVASTPSITATGAWFTGGSATTTKPQLLIEPSGATSAAWDTFGTGIGVNAASGFTGLLFSGQVDGVSKASISSSGQFRSELAATSAFIAGSASGGFYINGRWQLSGPADGQLLLRNDGGTDWSGVFYGGTTAAFPSIIKTNGHLRVSDGTMSATSTNGLFFSAATNAVANTITNMNQQSGRIILASGNKTYFMTNSLATGNSVVLASLNTYVTNNYVSVVPSAGLLTFQMLSNTPVNATISFLIVAP